MRISNNAFQVCSTTALFSAIFALILRDEYFSFNIHDAYFLISNKDLLILFTVVMSILAFVYWVFKKLKMRLYPKLTTVHIAFSIFNLFGIYTSLKISSNLEFDLFSEIPRFLELTTFIFLIFFMISQ